MSLDKQLIFNVIKANTIKVMPDIRPEDVRIDGSLSDLGANSIDRVEIVIYSLQDLGLKIPTSEMHGLKNVQGLVDLFHRYAAAQ
jgi:polyketide biosynthesis acyl carrier protein